jgi:hypothetical protein
MHKTESRASFVVVLLLAAVLLSAATVYAQVNDVGLRFIKVQQAKVHEEMLQGAAGNPWQYRILADVMIEPLIRFLRARGYPNAEMVGFIVFRFMQILFALVAAGLYYRRLGLSAAGALLGLSILTWSMSLSLYNSDLSFNVFFDVAFYLIAAMLISNGQLVWIVVLMLPAALNRETSILIPVMLACYYLFERPSRSNLRPVWIAAAAGVLLYGLIFAILRVHYGPQQFLTADGYYPGFRLLLVNLTRLVTWEQLLVTLGIVPLLAILAYTKWPYALRIFFWVVVPVWVVIHFTAALVAETRLLLVPQALIFIPGAVFGLMSSERSQDRREAPSVAETDPA